MPLFVSLGTTSNTVLPQVDLTGGAGSGYEVIMSGGTITRNATTFSSLVTSARSGIFPMLGTLNNYADGMFSGASVSGANIRITVTPNAQPMVEDLSNGRTYGLRAGVASATSALNAGSINYGLLRQQDALKRLKELESLHPSS